MKDAIKAIFDNKATWATLGILAGAFGDKAVAAVNALGVFVMAVI